MFGLYCLLAVLVIPVFHRVDCSLYTMTKGRRLSLAPLKTVTVNGKSFPGCVMRCRMTESCRTINARWDAASPLLTCELMGDGGALTLTLDPGWVFIEPEWTLAFRGTPGIEESVLDTWNQDGRHDDPYLMEKGTLLTSPLPHLSHIRTRVLDEWNDVEQVRLSVYKNNTVVAEVTFDGRGSNRMSWMDKTRILSSTWNDLTTAATSFFSVEGDTQWYRHFFMSQPYGNCDWDSAWFVVIDQADDPQFHFCGWEKPGPYPLVFYSPLPGAAYSFQFEKADFFMVHVRFAKN